MKLSPLITLFLAVALTSIPTLVAYSFGSGNCVAGEAGIGPPHGKGVAPTLNTVVTKGALSTGGFSVSIDGKTIKPGVSTKVTIKTKHALKVNAGTGKFFRGFSFRLSLPTASALVPLATDAATTIKNAICPSAKAVGVTHKTNGNKTVANATLLVSTKVNATLDVLIVVQNRNKKSIYYYNAYNLAFA